MEFVVRAVCSSSVKWALVPLMPLGTLILPPFCLFWIVLTVIIYYKGATFLNTPSGSTSKSWTRSLLWALAIQYLVAFVIDLAIVGLGCKAQSALPP